MPPDDQNLDPVTSSTYQPFESVYRNWLRSTYGGALPTQGFQGAYAAQTMPAAQLAYWSNPAAQEGFVDPYAQIGAGQNPFAAYLAETGANAYAPMSSQDWQDRAQAVQNALQATSTNPITERFGRMANPVEGQARQAALVNQAVLANTPMALRGETGNILQRLYDQWQATDTEKNYLSNRANIWSQFGIGA